ncbi:hypothetical protein VKS41_001132 [Umbelopsis sp. WA50703]|jgi:hypothetical protein
MLLDIAPELTNAIFSFLSIQDLYYLRGVNKRSQTLAERAIWTQIARSEHTTLQFGDKDAARSLNLYPHSYDAEHRVVEFRPKTMEPISLTDRSAASGDLMIRTFKLWFSGWQRHEFLGGANWNEVEPKLNAFDRAHMLFHGTYNPAHEKVYLLPSVHDPGPPRRTRYVGDADMVLALYYTSRGDDLRQWNYARTLNTQSTVTALAPPPERSVNVYSLKVSISWIMSGIQPNVATIELYDSYRRHLHHTLLSNSAFTYDPNCEQILEWLVSEDARNGLVPNHLVMFLKEHTHESLSKQAELQRLLESAGVDASVLWKYGFAKRWLAGKGAFEPEDVVRRIQMTEERWQKDQLSLRRQLARENIAI